MRRALDRIAAGDLAAAVGAGLAAGQEQLLFDAELAAARGDANAAIQLFSQAAGLPPENAYAHCRSAELHHAQGRLAEAAAAFRRASDIAPDAVDALLGQGQCSLELGDFEDARDCFEIAIAHDPAAAAAHRGLGCLLRLSGAAAEAVRVLQAACAQLPADADLAFELALSLNQQGDTDAAIAAYERALAIDPRHLGALVNLGLVYLAQRGDPSRAQALFGAARAAWPQSVAAQANYGLALQEQGDFPGALAHYALLVEQAPEVIEYRWNRGVANLYLGHFAQGWPDYEWRHVRGGRDVRRDFGLPAWDGGDAGSHQILVYGEQGVGDEIMFASCLPDLAATAAGVVLECEARLLPLFRRSFPGVRVHGAERGTGTAWLNDYPGLDRQIALGSLPRFYRQHAADFAVREAYLCADPARVTAWRDRLAAAGQAPRIGFSWRGGTRKTRADLRSLQFADCLPLLRSAPCTFVCLQRGDCGEELAAARAAGVTVQHWPEALENLEENAALIAALDLVISVDNTTVHLAGALGRPCWAMLASMPDWRYGIEGDSMPWYPSLRLFRQSRGGGWPTVVAAVMRELAVWRAV